MGDLEKQGQAGGRRVFEVDRDARSRDVTVLCEVREPTGCKHLAGAFLEEHQEEGDWSRCVWAFDVRCLHVGTVDTWMVTVAPAGGLWSWKSREPDPRE